MCGFSCLAATNDASKDQIKQRIQVTNTQRVDFQAGGTVRLKNSTGELTIEAWDQPVVEITTTKSTKAEYAPSEHEKGVHELDRVRVTAERKGAELVITTDFPKHDGAPPFSPFGGATKFDLDYNIKVPRDAKLVVDHNIGEVHVDGVTGDVHATALQGLIFLHLPEQAQYAIDAKSGIGRVKSDFEGTTERRLLFGDRFVESNGPHKLDLRIRFGDILIFKTEQPQTPAPAKL
jgi:hypothetical protein